MDIITLIGGDRWFRAGEAVAYGLTDEVIGGPAGTGPARARRRRWRR